MLWWWGWALLGMFMGGTHVPLNVPWYPSSPTECPWSEVKGVGGAKAVWGAQGCTLRLGMGLPRQLLPHCCSWLQTGSPGSPFSPWKGSKRSVPSSGGPQASQAPQAVLCLCPHSRTPAHGATAQLTLGPGSPANPRCPAWRESHCKERMCGVTLGCPLARTHSLGLSTHPVVSWWSWWPHGTRHAWGPWLSGPARAPWHAWQPILALLTLRADGTGWSAWS